MRNDLYWVEIQAMDADNDKVRNPDFQVLVNQVHCHSYGIMIL